MANIDWSKLTFSYTKTNTILVTSFKDGSWSPVESLTDDYMKVSTFCGAFHYAIECFEGLKAFRGKDGRIRLFRPEENAKRLIRSAKFLGIEAPSVEMFVDMCKRAVLENIDSSRHMRLQEHHFISVLPSSEPILSSEYSHRRSQPSSCSALL